MSGAIVITLMPYHSNSKTFDRNWRRKQLQVHISSPIPNASKMSSIEDSVKAVDLELSTEEVKRIDRHFNAFS